MGLKFRRSINISNNLKFNINKDSSGFTVGTKGAHYTANSKSHTSITVGLSKNTKRYCIIALILAYITLTLDLLLFATGNTLLGILFCLIFLIECASVKLAMVMDSSYLKSTASKVKQTSDTPTHSVDEKQHTFIYNLFDGAKGTKLTIIIFKILSFIAFVFIVLTAYLGEFSFMFVFAVQLVIYIIVITFCEESLKNVR